MSISRHASLDWVYVNRRGYVYQAISIYKSVTAVIQTSLTAAKVGFIIKRHKTKGMLCHNFR